MKIEQIAVGALTPYTRNSRTHSPEQVVQIAASIKEFGFTNPVLIDEDNAIIAGHGRLLAAQSIGMDKVPCLRLTGLSETQRRAYVIADNKLAMNAGWDYELLAFEASALCDAGFSLDLLGFDKNELSDLLSFVPPTVGLTDEDALPPVPEIPTSLPGDVWIMGRHKIICGSSTDKEIVARLLRGGVPHLMVTDPPYGVEYDASWRDGIKNNRSKGAAKGKVLNDNIADWREAWRLFPGEVVYVWHASTFANTVAESLTVCGFEIRAQIIWAKSQLVISRGHYHPQHEPCWYAVRKGKTASWNGGRKKTTLWRHIDDVLRPDEEVFARRIDAETMQAISGDESTLWEIQKPLKSDTGHSTQKPVECMRRPIQNNSKPGDEVYEPFSGSGTTIIAAEQTGRICYAVELSPEYVDVAVTRWQNFTGLEATQECTGKTFAEIQSDRSSYLG